MSSGTFENVLVFFPAVLVCSNPVADWLEMYFRLVDVASRHQAGVLPCQLVFNLKQMSLFHVIVVEANKPYIVI